jgi:Transglutaminase-like superfamily
MTAARNSVQTLERLGSRSSAATRKASLTLEVVGVYLHVRWLLRRNGPVPAVSMLRGGLDRPALWSVEAERTRLLRGLACGRAVVKVLKLLPTDSRCLMRSLVLTRVLARRGVYAEVVIGVRADPSFAAHAWVEVDGRPVLAADESAYRRLVAI